MQKLQFGQKGALLPCRRATLLNKGIVCRTNNKSVRGSFSRNVSSNTQLLQKSNVACKAAASEGEDAETGEKHWQLIPLTKKGDKTPISVPKGGVILGGSAQRSLPLAKAKSESLETATLRLTEDGLVIEDVANDTEVQGRRLKQGERLLLKHSDRILVGGTGFLVSSEAKVAEAPTDDGWQLPESESLLPDHRGRPPPPPVPYPVKYPELTAVGVIQWALGLGILYGANEALAKSTQAAGIAFPSPLIGMFAIIAVLLLVQAASKSAAENLYAFFDPALIWVARWLPVFYVPPLVTLPLAVQNLAEGTLLKIVLVILVGMPVSLTVTALIVSTIRKAVNTEIELIEHEKPAQPFSMFHHAFWGAVFVATLLGAAIKPEQYAHTLARPCLLAATVEGLLLGSTLPTAVQRILHPLVVCTLFANFAALVFAKAVGWSYKYALSEYITKGTALTGPDMMGAGNYLMSFLGVVILSFGFRIFSQRRLISRHAPEIFGSTTLSSAMSLFGTVAFARVLGLSSEIARALAPRSVTVALAIPIAQQLSAPVSIAAAAVALTGLWGSNCVQLLLDKLGHRDPITRGVATAAASHGLGTAALAGKEPEALPFCALAYALIGIISTILVSVPFVRAGLIALAG